jgi:hypothetical protein
MKSSQISILGIIFFVFSLSAFSQNKVIKAESYQPEKIYLQLDGKGYSNPERSDIKKYHICEKKKNRGE